jgi:hypothetical protein
MYNNTNAIVYFEDRRYFMFTDADKVAHVGKTMSYFYIRCSIAK